jgi:hypothetical protein
MLIGALLTKNDIIEGEKPAIWDRGAAWRQTESRVRIGTRPLTAAALAQSARCDNMTPFGIGRERRWCADCGSRREENVPPVSKGCFIEPAKPDVLRASHRPIYDTAGKSWRNCHCCARGNCSTTLNCHKAGQSICPRSSKQKSAS